MKKLKKIELFKGATSEIEFDLTGFNFAGGGYCQFVMKKMDDDTPIKTIDFEEPKKYTEIFTDDFTATLDEEEYRYDIMYMINDERYPQCKPSKIKVSEVVNEYTGN